MRCVLCKQNGMAVNVDGVCVACIREGNSVIGVPPGETEIVPTQTSAEIEAHLVNQKNTMLQDALLQTGIAVHPYSGRGMMGKECLAISGEIDNCREAMGEALIAMIEEFKQVCLYHSHIEAGDEQSNLNEIIRRMMRWNQDTMGYGVVFYWPGIPYDTSEDH